MLLSKERKSREKESLKNWRKETSEDNGAFQTNNATLGLKRTYFRPPLANSPRTKFVPVVHRQREKKRFRGSRVYDEAQDWRQLLQPQGGQVLCRRQLVKWRGGVRRRGHARADWVGVWTALKPAVPS